MKYLQFSAITTLALATAGHAYPNILEHMARQAEAQKPKSRLSAWNPLKKRTTFDAASQLISTTGDNAFVAPSGDDQRGPCPGLNALANHGYLPHNGVATITEFIDATTSVFGMGADLATILSTYGAVMDGDLTSWSIGGPTGLVSSIAELTGTPQGISGSHNKYEGDGSPTRGDLYQYGNDYLLQMSQFQELYDLGKADDSYDLTLLTDFRATRFQQSIENNPYFFYGPFSGVIVTPAAYTFIFRFMGNKSAEYPEGYLNGDVLKSFFSITGDDGDFTYTPGYEQIPDNWYTRNAADPYGVAELNVDTVAAGLEYPEFLVPGGNTGTTNSYLGLDPANLTGGIYTLDNLAEGNNALCLGFELTVQFLPDILAGLFTDIDPAEDELGTSINTVTGSLGCATLNSVDKDQFDEFPGYANLNSDGSY